MSKAEITYKLNTDLKQTLIVCSEIENITGIQSQLITVDEIKLKYDTEDVLMVIRNEMTLEFYALKHKV